MSRFRKRLVHPGIIVAAAALFVALGGGAYGAVQTMISGSQIQNHSIPEVKLTTAAVAGLGGTILTYDAAAASFPTTKVIGTVLGDTFAATCVSSAGDADLTVYLKTAGGAWTVDYDEVGTNSGAPPMATHIAVPAGTLNTFQVISEQVAPTGDNEADAQYSIVQLKPLPGTVILHATATTTSAPSTKTCHLSIDASPALHTVVQGAPRAAVKATHRRPLLLGKP
jgi:hypothetical protein